MYLKFKKELLAVTSLWSSFDAKALRAVLTALTSDVENIDKCLNCGEICVIPGELWVCEDCHKEQAEKNSRHEEHKRRVAEAAETKRRRMMSEHSCDTRRRCLAKVNKQTAAEIVCVRALTLLNALTGVSAEKLGSHVLSTTDGELELPLIAVKYFDDNPAQRTLANVKVNPQSAWLFVKKHNNESAYNVSTPEGVRTFAKERLQGESWISCQ